MAIIQHSTSKKIDVDDLKGKLADSVRRDKYSHPFSADGPNSDITLKYVEGKKRSGIQGRSKSPLAHTTIGNSSNNPMFDNASSSQATLKMYDQKETAPAWYKSLKKGLH